MIKSKKSVFILVLPLIFLCFSGDARAQELSCANVKEIVKIVAEDSTLHSITGAEIETKSANLKEYKALRMFWAAADKMADQYIKYRKDGHSYSYQAFMLTEGTSGKEEARKMQQAFKSCLGSDWFLKTEMEDGGDSVYYLKNPATYVVVKIWSPIGDVFIECYNDRKNGDQCVMGDCDSYFGSRHYFTDDIYNGTFLDGSLTGVGRIAWYRLKMGYEGSFIGNQIAGYGTMYYDGDKVLNKGLYFKGDPATIDTTKYTCQYGNCNTGFGLKVIKGGFYVGNFKDSLYNGLGELVMNKTFFYGYFEKNQINGKGIYINAAGEYVFATYAKGRAVGNYEKDYADKTSREANVDGSGSMFDEENILIESGVWGKAGFTQYTDAAYLDSKNFAKSLKDFYAYRKTSYKEIRAAQDKGLQSLGIEFYKSKLLFLNAFETNISADHKYNYFVAVNLSGKSIDKLKGIDTYNKYYNNLNKALGSRWRTHKDDGLASAQKNKAEVILENIFDKSRIISLSLDRGSVRMEIH